MQKIFRGSEVTLYDTIMMYLSLSNPLKCTTPRVNPNVNGGLGVIMMCRCRFINYCKCTSLVGDVDNGDRKSVV